jgi:hypothetical protein
MPNEVHMVRVGRFEKLLEVIGGLSCLALEVALSSVNKLLIEVVGLLIVATFVTAGSDRSSLGSPPLPLLFMPLPAALGIPLNRCWGPPSHRPRQK